MTVTLLTSQSAPTATDADALVTGVFQGPDGPVLTLGTDEIDLTAALSALGATGKAEEIAKIPTASLAGGPARGVRGDGIPPGEVSSAVPPGQQRLATPVIVAVGLGPEPGTADAGPAERQAYLERLRRASGAATRDLTSSLPGQAKRIAIALPAGEPDEAEAVALGGLLGSYTFRKYRTATSTPGDVEQIVYTAHEDAAGRARILAGAMALVRDLVNTAPADLVPADLAAVAEQAAAAHGLGIQVLDENELAKEGFGGILAVGKGSAHPPRLVRLEYTHPDAARTVVFAGKGITFDSGGLSLKPPKAMETMKADMSGAAAVLAAVQAIAELGPAVNVVGYLPLAENMPGGGAQRPSDVITIYGGKTVEVLNTDAEGRLVLADALARSGADGPSLLIDVATLTGAQTVALGNRTAGVMASDDSLAAGIADAARRAGEAMWPMPLPEDLRKGLDSAVADIANVSGDRSGGMLVAGLFLREFVPAGVPWAHLDIAGPAYNDGGAYGYVAKGGTGAAVRTLVRIAADVAEGKLAGLDSGPDGGK